MREFASCRRKIPCRFVRLAATIRMVDLIADGLIRAGAPMRKSVGIVVSIATLALALATWTVFANGSPPETVGGGWGSIHHAADEGDVGTIVRLINRGADVNERTKHGWTPLHLAAKKGYSEAAAALIERGADLNAVGWGATPMQDAAFNSHMQIGERLREAGATVDVSSAAAFGWIDKLARILDEEPRLLAGWEQTSDRVERCPCPLHYASKSGQVDAVKLLLERGVVVDSLDESRRTPLHLAAEHGRTEIAELLIEAGHPVEVTVRNTLTPLQLAAYRGHTATVGILLKHGANPQLQHGRATAIELARERGHDETVRLLTSQ